MPLIPLSLVIHSRCYCCCPDIFIPRVSLSTRSTISVLPAGAAAAAPPSNPSSYSCLISLCAECHLNIYYFSIPQHVCSSFSYTSSDDSYLNSSSTLVVKYTLLSTPSSAYNIATQTGALRREDEKEEEEEKAEKRQQKKSTDTAGEKTRIYMLSIANRFHIETIFKRRGNSRLLLLPATLPLLLLSSSVPRFHFRLVGSACLRRFLNPSPHPLPI